MVTYKFRRQFKNRLFLIFFFSQLLFFIISYLFGSTGISFFKAQVQEIESIRSGIELERSDIEKLKSSVADWKGDMFIKEKFARENLHMARPQENIYIIV